jgi:uncharacterized protein YerC
LTNLSYSDRIDIAIVGKDKSFKSLKTSTQESIMSISQVGRELNASTAANKATLELIRDYAEAMVGSGVHSSSVV